MTDKRLHRALQKWWIKAERARWQYGTLGRTNSDGSVTINGDRQDYAWVTMASGTLAQAYNKGNGAVPSRAGLPVRVRDDAGRLIIDGYDERLLEGDANLPGAHGVLPHAATHQDGGSDEVATVTPAAGAIPKADPDGYIGAGWLDPADLASGTVTSVNGQTGVVVLDPDDLDDTSTTNKFTTAAEITKLAGIEALADVTDAGNIASSITGVSTDDTIVDADVWGYLTGGVLVKTAWSNIKAVLKTYFDTLYNLYVHPNHTGDVTSVADGATTIAADAVTFAKMQNIATDSLIGRDTASSGDPENILLNATLSMDGSGNLQRAALTGDVTASAGSNATAIGANKVLTTMIADANVTLAKLANIATDSLIGRDTASSGVPENILLNATLSMDGSGNLQRAALTGDVTASAGSNATAIGSNKVLTAMIADAQVTLAKMADLAQATIIGRAAAAGTGVPTALSAAQVVAIIQASIDHGSIAGLGDDDHTQYALLAGRAGGQTLKGGTASGDDLTLESTNHATKGTVFINPNGGDAQIGKSGTVLIFGDGSGSAGANFNGAAGNVRDFVYQSAGSARWILRVNATAESGSNAGSDLEISSRTDAGAALVTALTITRATGAIDILGPVVINEAGADKDVRMEGDTNANLFFLDASTDRIGIGTASPGSMLNVTGAVDFDSTLNVDGATTLTTATVKPGSASDTAVVGGVLSVSTAQGANTLTGEDDLATYSVPANTLTVNGQSIWFEAWGSFAANGNNKQIRARFGTSGTNLMIDTGAVAINNQDWYVRGRIVRTGAATQKSIAQFSRATVATDSVTGLNQTLSGAVTLKITGEAVATNDILLEGFIVGFDDNNT